MSLSTVTRASLGVRALQRANLQYSSFIAADELNQLVDTSMAKIYNLLVGLYQDYFVKSQDFTLDSTVQDYALPADYFKSRQMFVRDSSGNQYELQWMELAELLAVQGGSFNGSPAGYNIIDGRLTVYPVGATMNGTLRLYYVPEYTPPIDDQAQIKYAVAFGWDEWVVNDLAIQIRNKAMMPANELLQERQLIETRMVHEATNRQAGQPRRVVDKGWSRGTGSRGRGDFSRR